MGGRRLIEEPILDVAHLGRLELLTPTPEKSLDFFVNVLGMTESGRSGDSVYLRGWDDYERYSLKLTASNTSGLGHAAFRARSPQALQRRVAALEAAGAGVGWLENELGHEPAYQFRDPDGHLLELYYETEWYEAPPELKPSLKNQAFPLLSGSRAAIASKSPTPARGSCWRRTGSRSSGPRPSARRARPGGCKPSQASIVTERRRFPASRRSLSSHRTPEGLQ